MSQALPDMRLDGKIAFISGAGSGIGRALALGMAASGATIAMSETSARLSVLDEVSAEIGQAGGESLAVALDLPRLESIDAAVDAVIRRFGRVDILVNNAGVNRPNPAFEVTEAEWDEVLDVNLKGLFFTAQRFGRHMTQAGYGRIVNIASQNGVVAYYQRAAYCASKAGVVNLTRVLAVEWAEHGINVNAVGPTFVLTPLTQSTFDDEDLRRDLLDRIPLGRVARPEDVVGAVVFLASEAAAMITGHTLLVDGGWTAL
jgi:2-dehydro-3-deoxy-D-gluconate 5-dehydrogenase